MEKRARVKVDIDNVLNDLTMRVVDVYSNEHKVCLSYNDIIDYNFNGIGDEVVISGLIEMLNRPDILEDLTPLTDSQAGLMMLCKDYDVWLATASTPEAFVKKVKWCKQYFPWFETDRIICIKDKFLLRTDYSIDDLPDNLIGDLTTRILVDSPWNKSYRDDAWGFHRVNDLVEAYHTINKLQDEFESMLDIRG